MKKNFWKKTLLTAAITASVLATGGIANATQEDTDKLNDFLKSNTETTLNLTSLITLTDNITTDISTDVSKTISGDIFGDKQYRGFVLGVNNEFNITSGVITGFKSSDNGAAINNAGLINNLGTSIAEGVIFSGNKIEKELTTGYSELLKQGGVIYNAATGVITNIFAEIKDNNVKVDNSSSNDHAIATAQGGAVYNLGKIDSIKVTTDSITGLFNTNTVEAIAKSEATGTTADAYAQGGAVYNETNAKIGDILGDFKKNSAKANAESPTKASLLARGGAVFNKGQIDSITGDFTNNYADANSTSVSVSADAQGGAIYSEKGAVIKSIVGDFTENYAKAKAESQAKTTAIAQGGAVFNQGQIDSIEGDFTNNYADAYAKSNVTDKTANASAQGGAIYSEKDAVIKSIVGDFTNNYTKAKAVAMPSDKSAVTSQGGAIYNAGTIGDENKAAIGTSITEKVTFENNGFHALNALEPQTQQGGAIYNKGNITNIYADFTGNRADEGGAIYNFAQNTGQSEIISINGNFTSNIAKISGGAISNTAENAANDLAKIGNIFGNFTGNYVKSTTNDVGGGAISNLGTIDNIGMIEKKVSFTNNYVDVDGNQRAGGGAIYNVTTIDNIYAQFNNNYAKSSSGYAYGGAIVNQNLITKIGIDDKNKSEFNNNGIKDFGKATQSTETNYGGAITNYAYNDGTEPQCYTSITSIYADFTGNKAKRAGGAIYNYAESEAEGKTANAYIGLISGKFEKNSAGVHGGAIYNNKGPIALDAEIKEIGTETNHAKFEGNFVSSTEIGVYGGAIYNAGTIDTINADFTGNYSNPTGSKSTEGGAGAIHNRIDATINSIGTATNHVKFENNYVTAKNAGTYAGAIWNNGTIKEINADFKGNYAETEGDSKLAQGGAILNYQGGTIGEGEEKGIGTDKYKVTFESNGINNNQVVTNYGGAIYNYSNASSKNITTTISNIYADFTGNKVKNNGGAIYNYAKSETDGKKAEATINLINGDFKYNSAGEHGGAIYNVAKSENPSTKIAVATIKTINANFEGNSATGENVSQGGAIYNEGTIGTIDAGVDKKLLFNKNNATSTANNAQGGAIYNEGKINNIYADFTGNYASATATAKGGAIYNKGTIGSSIGRDSDTGKAQFSGNGIIDNVTPATNFGGAIYNEGTIQNIYADFNKNVAIDMGGAIYNNSSSSIINTIKGTFDGNTARLGGAIWNEGTINNIGISDTAKAKFKGNGVIESAATTESYGGAIYNEGTIQNIYADFEKNALINNGAEVKGGAIYNKGIIKNITGDFSGNYVKSESESIVAKGGAIYNDSSSSITFNNATFENNYVIYGGTKYYNDIYNDGTIEISGNVSMTGGIKGSAGTTSIKNGTLTLLHAKDEAGTDKGFAKLEQDIVAINNGTLNVQNGFGGDKVEINHLTVPKQTEPPYSPQTANFKIDIDYDLDAGLLNNDVFYIKNVGTDQGNIKLTDVIMLNDIAGNSGTRTIYWAKTDKVTGLSNTWNDTTKTLYAATKDYFYTFKGAGEGGSAAKAGEIILDMDNSGKQTISKLDIHEVIAGESAEHEDYTKIWYYTLGKDLTETEKLTKNLGTLGGVERTLTIDGAGHTIDGNKNKGIEINAGQTFALENITMKNFKTTASDEGGAVIVNKGTIDHIGTAGKNVIFTENTTIDKSVSGGVIKNSGIIKNINADFTKNSVLGQPVYGGVIHNEGIIGYFDEEVAKGGIGTATQKALFKENTITASKFNILGGVIYNEGKITNISADFIGNKSISKGNIYGGVINNVDGAITNIGSADNKAIFTSNIVQATGNIGGGIICNDAAPTAIIKNINADFTNNTIEGEDILGGVINNTGDITNIAGSFVNNSVTATGMAQGGAIYNDGTIENVTATFENNTAKLGGAIYNDISGKMKITNSTFKANKATKEQGGAIGIYEFGQVEISDTTFTQNEAATYGGAIDVRDNAILVINNATFNENKALSSNGGAINSNGIIEVVKSTFNNNYSQDGGGAIMVFAGSAIIANSTFTNNTAAGDGGAINVNNNAEATIINSTFSGNTAKGVANDIYNKGTVKFKGINTMDAGITGKGETVIGDGTTITSVTFNGNSKFEQDTVKLNNNAVLNLAMNARSMSELNPINNFIVNGGTINTQNNEAAMFYVSNLVLNGDVNMMVDADLANLTMDTINATNYSGTGNIHVSDIRLLSDATTESVGMTFVLNEDGLRDKVDYTGQQGISYSPIYKYDVAYDKKTGMFNFSRSGGVDAHNPAVLASSAAVEAGTFVTQINSYNEAFANMDQVMLMPRKERTAWRNANKYAAQGEGTGNGIITYSPNQFPEQERGVYFRPFASFESVPLNNGPRVDNISYGGLVGGDSDMISLKHGWDMVWGAYAGYNGSHQNFQGNSIYQNGGMVGVNSVWYKGDFFTGLTVNVGASVANATTMYGREDMTMLSTGVASKTGYNWELFDSKFIIQPSFLMSYSFINTFDYKSASGLDMHSDPLNAIQLVPGLKFIGNLPKGWQPYVGVSMIWNLMDKTKFYANDVALPQMSMDPYVQYGLGVQKRWGEKFTGFGQLMFRNGGRNGIAVDAGFRYELGKGGLNLGKKSSLKHYTQRNISLTTK